MNERSPQNYPDNPDPNDFVESRSISPILSRLRMGEAEREYSPADVTASVMEKVMPVIQATVSRLHKIVERCHELERELNAHSDEIRSKCEERDATTRALLENTARFANMVNNECKSADVALTTIADNFRLEPSSNA